MAELLGASVANDTSVDDDNGVVAREVALQHEEAQSCVIGLNLRL
jgi:hypothetical protein